MRKEHIVKRVLTLAAGLWVMALGVAFSIAADLGTSPISGVPYTVSMFTPFSVGILTIMMHVVFIVIQIILLGKDYSPMQLLQLPVAFIFGFMTDAAVFMLKGLEPGNYAVSMLFCLTGIVLVAIGVSAEVASDTVPLAGEGLAIAISRKAGLKFGTAKVAVDCSLVALSLILSFSFIGTMGGVREGTILAAILVGTIARQISKAVMPLRKRYL